MNREALMTLGISGDPGLVEIRKAYLAKVAQPQFQRLVFENEELGRDFSRIHEAYVTLIRELADKGMEIPAPASTADLSCLLFNQGVYAMIQQNFLKAGEKFQEAERIRPNTPLVRLYMGVLLLKRKNLYAAEKYLREATRLLPELDSPWLYLAETYEHAGNYKNAEAALHKAMQVNPSLTGIAERIKSLRRGKPSWETDESLKPSLLDRILDLFR